VIPLPEEGGEWSQVMKRMREEKEKKDASEAVVPETMDRDDAAAVKELLEGSTYSSSFLACKFFFS
jgi:hypothetical protein